MLSETGSMLNGRLNPCPFSQLMPMLPRTGTFSCMSVVGVKRRTMVVVSVDANAPISLPVTAVIQVPSGSDRLILPVVP